MKLRTLEKRLSETEDKITNCELRASIIMATARKLREQANYLQVQIAEKRKQRGTV